MDAPGWSEVTSRERGVLAAVERRLSNTEIAAELHISVRTVESHIASLRRKLGVDSRAKLISAARAGRAAAVPVPHNSFVGRDGDLATLQALLQQERWVTVVGAAGCGKTRLALELAAAGGRTPIVAELEHAVPREVVGVVAKAIGLGQDAAGDLVTASGLALERQPYLLVLDNCDRVSESVVTLVGTLLRLAPSLTVLATSRSPLGGSGETTFALAPLPVGGSADGAVQLFLDRARAAAPTLAISAADEPTVHGICRRLDGLPLAIELAAARVRHLPLGELSARLDQGFDALDRTGPGSRHHTLEAAFDWTWDLLDDDERSVLSRLAGLPRTFDLELAEAVTAPGAGHVVLQLLDRSLLTPAAKRTEPARFRMLESLRDFVLDRTSPDVVAEVRRSHAAYYVTRALRLHGRARTDDSRAATEEAAALCPELNAAVDWAMTHQHELVLPLVRTLAVGGEQYGTNTESLGTIARAARDPRIRAAATTTELMELGIALCYCDVELAGELAVVALDRASDDESSLLAAHHLAGHADAYRHKSSSALAHLEEAQRLADKLLDMWQLASARQISGIALHGLGRPDAAMAAFESAMRTFALAGDAMHVNNARFMMAGTAAELGLDPQQVISWAEQCAEYARASGNRHELAHAVLTRARVSTGPEAEGDLAEAIDAFRAVGDLRCLTRSYLRLAEITAPPDQVQPLELALDVARRAGETAQQATALERLIRAHCESGAARDAATALGALVGLIGYDAAVARCPDVMVREIERWAPVIAEGQARFAGQPPSGLARAQEAGTWSSPTVGSGRTVPRRTS